MNILSYFALLWKNITILICLSIISPLILISKGYSGQIWAYEFVAFLGMGLPWLLLCQQIFFSGFSYPKNYFHYISRILIASLISTLLLCVLSLALHYEYDFQIHNIAQIPQPVTSKIMTQNNGTLINLEKEPDKFRLFAQPSTKMIWINEHNLIFDQAITNGINLELSKVKSFDVYGYYPQIGTMVFPMLRKKPIIPVSPFGIQILQFSINQIFGFHKNLDQLMKEEQISSFMIKVPITHNEIHPNTNSHITFSSHKNSFQNYSTLFSKLWIIMLCGSLLGILLSINTTFFGFFAYFFLAIFLIPNYLFKLLNHLPLISAYFPNIKTESTDTLCITLIILLIFILSWIKINTSEKAL